MSLFLKSFFFEEYFIVQESVSMKKKILLNVCMEKKIKGILKENMEKEGGTKSIKKNEKIWYIQDFIMQNYQTIPLVSKAGSVRKWSHKKEFVPR